LGHSDEAEALLPAIENAPNDPSLQNLGHFLRGIFLCLSKGAAESLKYYARSTDLVTPLLWKSGGGYLTAAHLERQAWLKQAFDWEKKQLALQLQLWHGCSKSNEPEIPK
jgi:predicted mannosyl-3-phosphoglycerate phosphatase (HAD superfamily)